MPRPKKGSSAVKSVTAERFSLLRKRLNLSQARLASVIGEEFDQVYISRISRGARLLEENEAACILHFLIDPKPWLKATGIEEPQALPIVRFPWAHSFGEEMRKNKLRELIDGVTDPTLETAKWIRLLDACADPPVKDPFRPSKLLSVQKSRREGTLDEEVGAMAEEDTKHLGFEFVSKLLTSAPTHQEVLRRMEELDSKDARTAKKVILDTLHESAKKLTEQQAYELLEELGPFRKNLEISNKSPQHYLIDFLAWSHLEDRETNEPTYLRVFRLLGFLQLLSTKLDNPTELIENFARNFERARKSIEGQNREFEDWQTREFERELNLRSRVLDY